MYHIKWLYELYIILIIVDRTATDTIRGYFYQFDYAIQRLLELKSDEDSITIEGVEDIDESTDILESAIQCKYYAKTEYNHSIIAKPVRLMLTHFKDVENDETSQVKYFLYGHFMAGHNKFPSIVDLSFLKEHLLTYTEKRIRKEHHTSLGLDDDQLRKFITLLNIDIHAKDYDSQQDYIIELLKSHFNCDLDEALWHYYPNAIRTVKNLATKEISENRKISKANFLIAINRKETLFNAWFIQLKGEEKYFKALKKKYFTQFNVSPAHRLFLIESKDGNRNSPLIKDVLRHISHKFSKLSKRAKPKFCPYVYLHSFPTKQLVQIKSDLISEGFRIIDGHDFLGSAFSVNSISKEPKTDTEIKLKIFNVLDDVKTSLEHIPGQIEVYQFYGTAPYLVNIKSSVKQAEIQLDKLEHLLQIV